MSQDRDPLLEALAAAARAERAREPQDPRLDALVVGDLADADRAALAADAADDEALAAALLAFEPIDGPGRGRLFDAALAAFDGAAETLADPPAALPAPPAVVAAPGAKVIPFRRSLVGRAVTALVPLALAAGLAFVLLRPGGPPVDPVPAFSAEITGGERALRGDEPAAHEARRLGPGSRLAVVLVPEQPVAGAVALRAWLVQGDTARPWPVTAQTGPTGAHRVAGTYEALGLGDVPAGRWTAVFAVGRAEALPQAAPSADPPGDAGWRRLTVPLELTR